MRVVRAPSGEVSFDLSGRAPGRGAYLCADGSCWETAARKRSLERALNTKIPREMQERLASGTTDTIGGETSGA